MSASNAWAEFAAVFSRTRSAHLDHEQAKSFSEEGAAEKYMPQLQHNMWVVNSKSAVLSVITGGGKWVEITTHADALYQHLIRSWGVTASHRLGFYRNTDNEGSQFP